MNKKTLRLLLALCASITFISACSEEEYLPESTKSDCEFSEGGEKLDNTPFKWEYFYSTDSLSQSDYESRIFVADLMYIATDTSRAANTRGSVTTDRKSSGSDGSDTRRSDSGSNDNYRKEEILISNPIPVYLGAAFPAKEFGKSFKPEILYPRNPIDVIFHFTNPYIGEITKENGSIGYYKLLKEALKSNEYKSHISKGAKESFEFICSEYYSYSDIEKAFSANAGLAKIFTSKIQNNTKTVKAKSKLLGQLTSRCFTISMDIPTNGLFKDKAKNTAPEEPVYVYSITYGKVALLSVESEYSFEEVKSAVEANINYKIFSAGGNYSQKAQEIIAKSKITLFIISDDKANEQTFYTTDNIKSAFNLSYSEENPGYPVFCQGNYTKDNSAFYLSSGSSRPSRGDSGSGSQRR